MTSAVNGPLVIHDFGICGTSCDHRVPPPAEIDICRAWLREWAIPRASFNTRTSSYGLKHDVERASRTGAQYTNVDRQGRVWKDERVYVSNGSFIAAALLEGYRVRQCWPDNPNAYFNLSVHKHPASLMPRAAVTFGQPSVAIPHATRDAIMSLSRVTGSITRTARALGVSIGTVDRALMGLRLRAPTARRIIEAAGRRAVHSHEVIQ